MGARRHGFDPNQALAPHVVRWKGESNQSALRTLPWFYASEIVSYGDFNYEFAGTVQLDASGARLTSMTADIAMELELISKRLPSIPWSTVVISRRQEEFPRAISTPGWIVVSHKVNLNSPAEARLYLLHELLHQWIGGLVAMPIEDELRGWAEAVVDALVWHVVGEVRGDRAATAFASLYERYEDIDGLAQVGSMTRRAHDIGRDALWRGAIEMTQAAQRALASGNRFTFSRPWFGNELR